MDKELYNVYCLDNFQGRFPCASNRPCSNEITDMLQDDSCCATITYTNTNSKAATTIFNCVPEEQVSSKKDSSVTNGNINMKLNCRSAASSI